MAVTEPRVFQDSSGPAISVVIPVGRVDRWLDEAVESVLAEDAIDFELIAVFNNGAEVPVGWRFLDDPRLNVIFTPKSLGPAGAGQLGIESARGRYLACLDSDDLALPMRLRSQHDWMEAHPEAVLVSSQVDWIDEEGRRVGAFDLPTGADVREELLRLNVAPHSSWMVRLSSVREVGGYDLAMSQMEDYDLLLRLGALGPIAVLGETLTAYRLHGKQMSRVVRPNGDYIHRIASSRSALGRAIGVGRLRIARARCWWETQQWVMFFGRRIRS